MPKVIINLSQGILEVEGPEEFVISQVNQFQEKMLPTVKEISDKVAQLKITSKTLDDSSPITLLEGNTQTVEEKYPNVFSLDSLNKIHILNSNGNTNAEKTKSLTLLYLLAKKDLLGEEYASAQEIRDICKKHGCFDSNFARVLDGLKGLLMPVGKVKSKSKSYELTVPGINEAIKLAEELNSDVKST